LNLIIKKILVKSTHFILSLVFLWGVIPGEIIFAQDGLDQEIKDLEAFAKVYQLIQAKYYKSVSRRHLIEAAIQGMIDSLDQHTQALNRKSMSLLEKQSIGNYNGIGVTLGYQDFKYIVLSVVPDSPADISGLKPDDVIIQINGIIIKPNQSGLIDQALMENTDQPVRIHFYHPHQPQNVIKVNINRASIRLHSTELIRHTADVLIIKIKEFQKHTVTEILKGLQNQNFTTIIIDLRNNPGGLLLSAIETTQIFLGQGNLVEVRDKNDKLVEKYVSRNRKTDPNLKLYVLLNNRSASAAEILAGALKDREVGTIIGEQSYGKGTVQTIYPIHDDLYIKLTTASYYTASGISFDGIGVTPHFKIKDTDAELYSKKDLIFQKALALSREKPSKN
jgi:carboxyl-terminal processing protease